MTDVNIYEDGTVTATVISDTTHQRTTYLVVEEVTEDSGYITFYSHTTDRSIVECYDKLEVTKWLSPMSLKNVEKSDIMPEITAALAGTHL